MSSNMLADRLRELDARAVVHRRRLAPPAGSWVYELTDWGRELEPAVLALGAWGVQAPPPPEPATLGATSVLLFLRASARPDPTAAPAVYRVRLDDRMWTVRTADGQVHVEPGEPPHPDASVHATPHAFNAVLTDPASLDAAIAGGSVVTTGDLPTLRRLLRSVAQH